METAKPKYSEAKLFRDIVLAACPTQWLAYNQSPSSAEGGAGCFDTVWRLLSIAIFSSFLLRCSMFFFLFHCSLSLAIPPPRENTVCGRSVFSWRFNWDASGMSDEEMSTFIWDLGKIGPACCSRSGSGVRVGRIWHRRNRSVVL